MNWRPLSYWTRDSASLVQSNAGLRQPNIMKYANGELCTKLRSTLSNKMDIKAANLTALFRIRGRSHFGKKWIIPLGHYDLNSLWIHIGKLSGYTGGRCHQVVDVYLSISKLFLLSQSYGAHGSYLWEEIDHIMASSSLLLEWRVLLCWNYTIVKLFKWSIYSHARQKGYLLNAPWK